LTTSTTVVHGSINGQNNFTLTGKEVIEKEVDRVKSRCVSLHKSIFFPTH
jgi:hypothetical protein